MKNAQVDHQSVITEDLVVVAFDMKICEVRRLTITILSVSGIFQSFFVTVVQKFG